MYPNEISGLDMTTVKPLRGEHALVRRAATAPDLDLEMEIDCKWMDQAWASPCAGR